MRGAELSSPHPVFIFDGHCVLCSGGAAFIMRHDPEGKVRFLSAQSPLGSAIYAHYGLPLDASYILIAGDGTHMKTDGFFNLADILGGWFKLGKIFKIIPRPIRDWVYGIIAHNRYSIFGQSEDQCAILSPQQRAQLVDDDEGLRAQLS